MKETTKTYVELLYPGSFMAEDETRVVTKRDPKAIAKKYPRAFRLQFFDLTSAEVTVDGVARVVSGNRKNLSPKYFPGGTVLTQVDVAGMDNAGILLSNMKCNGWDEVVRTRSGNYQPFEKGCEVI